ncbi:unnamed protein product [Soboliphyme baturini]|uniref:Uncharacterized protein n=1 Tax=Soboliphyme baturini TaxID=241478 RepID=A0A183J137_9BILA|nr:unnamed protein product [Soboliphyme baturini]
MCVDRKTFWTSTRMFLLQFSAIWHGLMAKPMLQLRNVGKPYALTAVRKTRPPGKCFRLASIVEQTVVIFLLLHWRRPDERNERFTRLIQFRNSSSKVQHQWWKAPEFVPRLNHIDSYVDGIEPTCIQPQNYAIPPVIFQPERIGGCDLNLATNVFPQTSPVPPFSAFGKRFPTTIQPMNWTTLPSPSVMPLPAVHGVQPLHVWPQKHLLPLRPLPPALLNPRGNAKFLQLNQKGSIPPGYTANFTTINPGIGPPIPAILIKKKRRKKPRKIKSESIEEETTCNVQKNDESKGIQANPVVVNDNSESSKEDSASPKYESLTAFIFSVSISNVN